ncbi:hypothetical protein [Burkholderia sp. BCC0322]|uniref:hypothetical protein n=1 Tax=unclassified Burkholderia TaxID=2613784 RepID=UPI00158979AC|nr:hypothetical protein [Burkholderia sp. BCC0322]
MPICVVSGRLHGALESVLQGRPAYHVSYARKGFGTYANQHLDDSVVNGAAFDPDLVAKKSSPTDRQPRSGNRTGWRSTGFTPRANM